MFFFGEADTSWKEECFVDVSHLERREERGGAYMGFDQGSIEEEGVQQSAATTSQLSYAQTMLYLLLWKSIYAKP
jgi:hypothetical protein